MFALQYDENGNWLDSPILIESVGTHDGPEYGDDVTAYLDLYASLEGLCQYHETLSRLRGINQHYAVEAYEYIPNWAETMPKAYYSQHLSQVQYKYTQESLVKAFWETVKKIWDHFVQLIKRIINRVFGRAESTTGVSGLVDAPITPEEVKEAEETVRKAQYGIRKKKTARDAFAHTVSELQREVLGKGFTMIVGGQQKDYHNLNTLLDDIFNQPEAPAFYKKIYFTADPLWRDMVTDGPYSQYLVQVAKQLQEIAQTGQAKIHSFEMALQMLDTANFNTAIDAMQKLARADHMVTVEGTPVTLSEIRKHMQTLRQEWIVQQHDSEDGHDDFTLFGQKTMHYWSDRSLEAMLEGILKAVPDMGAIAQGVVKTGELLERAKDQLEVPHLGQVIREALDHVRQEAAAAAEIIAAVQEYLVAHKHYVDQSHAMIGYFMRLVHPFMTQYDNARGEMPQVVKSLSKIMDQLKD